MSQTQVCEETKFDAHADFDMSHEGMAELGAAAWGLGLAAIILAVVLTVLGQLKATLTASSAEYNAVGTAITAIATFASWFGIIVVVYAAGVVLSSMGFLGGKSGGGA